jgi:hypothetical protein
MRTYAAVFPIVASRDLDALYAEADAALTDLLEADGYAQAGPAAVRIEDGWLHARVPVDVEYAVAGDMRPWESREAQAAEWWDRWAE